MWFFFFEVIFIKCIFDVLLEVDKYGCEVKVVDVMKKLGDFFLLVDDLKEVYCWWDRKYYIDWVCLLVMNVVNVLIWYCF